MFIGSKKILSEKKDGEFILIKFEDKTTAKFSKEQLDYYKTEKKVNETDFFHKKKVFLSGVILEALKKHCVTVQEAQIACDSIAQFWINDDLRRYIMKRLDIECKDAQPKNLAEVLTLEEIYKD